MEERRLYIPIEDLYGDLPPVEDQTDDGAVDTSTDEGDENL